MLSLVLNWQGPFEFTSQSGRSILTAGAGSLAGVYVWGVETRRGLLPYYVGETKTSFARRHLEHFQEYAMGAYSTRDGQALERGDAEYLFRGIYRRAHAPAEYQPFIDDFERMAHHLALGFRLTRIFVAELAADQRVRRRVEAGLVDAFYAAPAEAQSLFLPDYRRWKQKPDEAAIAVRCESPPPILGFPAHFEV